MSRIRIRFAWPRLLIVVLLGLVALVGLLFCINGLWLGHGTTPYHQPAAVAGDTRSAAQEGEIKVMAYNIAKCFVFRSAGFEEVDLVRERLDEIAEVIKAERPDFVFLCEAVFECGPCPVNQVQWLADATGMNEFAYGENYNFGVPGYRVTGGNAILSRWPLRTVANPSLAGRKPFFITKNNRRVLWCSASIGDQEVLLASVHNDSFNLSNNLAQMQQLLAFAEGRPVIMAGDFNARPGESPIRLLRTTNRFVAAWDGPLTFPARRPKQKIDFIFAPANWQLREHRAIPVTVSDHLPIISTFAIPHGE